ncbi:GntR family transcriptional regulator [Microbacterium indicum]|uniref:GntR family transcriptional regulator n=1 Tax=Microbacterium indicum TaxID=358100 RepID=UPI0003FB239C|nr:GntR family transcriptional regulator [Microbacterium indicum]
MLVRIDPTRAEPVFAQIAGSVRADIAAGRVRAGERLPAAKEVAQALDINLHTVLHAYRELRDEGLISMRPGRGAVVAELGAALAEMQGEIDRLVERAAALGIDGDTLASLVAETTHDRRGTTR